MRLLKDELRGLGYFLLVLCAMNGQVAKAYEGRLVPGVWQEPWSQGLNVSLGKSQLLGHSEKQIERLCPGYAKAPPKRLLFWQQLLLSLSWKESLHGPGNYIRFNGGINSGLFQIDPKVRKYYGCNGYDLFDPIDNIDCAVKMADHLVARFGSFLVGPKQGMAAYWQPLRSTSKRNSKDRKFILGAVTQACHSGALVYHSVGRGFTDEEVSGEINTLDDLGIDPRLLEP